MCYRSREPESDPIFRLVFRFIRHLYIRRRVCHKYGSNDSIHDLNNNESASVASLYVKESRNDFLILFVIHASEFF